MLSGFDITFDYLNMSLLAFVPAVLGLMILAYIAVKIPPKREVRVFMLFVISCTLWQISEGFLRLSGNIETALFWNRCISLTILPAAATGLHFALLFSQKAKMIGYRIVLAFIYVPLIVFEGAQILNLYAWTVIKVDGWNWLSNPNLIPIQKIEIIWTSFIALYTIFVLAVYALESRKKEATERLRSATIFVGYLIPSVVGIICQIILPQIFGFEELPLTSPAMIFFSLFSIVGLKKYSLFKYSSSFPAHHILKGMNEGVIIVDYNFQIRYSNTGFSKLIGLNRKELLGKSLESIGLIYLKKEIFNDEYQQFSERKELEFMDALGNRKIVFFSWAPYTDKSGMNTGKIFLFNDITEIIEATETAKSEKKQALIYQSQLMSTQLNPHFIYNSLNSIQFYVLEKNIEPALDYISTFSKLMRNVLDNSTTEYITLADEISFLDSYLHLEQRRFRSAFTYTINVCDDLDPDDLLIAPMLLQPYIENAIIHGLSTLRSGGILSISFTLINGAIFCEIQDNGVGRNSAIQLKQGLSCNSHKSHAMNITQTRLEILNKITSCSHSVKIIDLKDQNDKGTGTIVVIAIPQLRA